MPDNMLDDCENVCIKTKIDCGVGCGVCFVHLFGVVDVEKSICIDHKKFFVEKKYPFAVLIIAESNHDHHDCPKHHQVEECV